MGLHFRRNISVKRKRRSRQHRNERRNCFGSIMISSGTVMSSVRSWNGMTVVPWCTRVVWTAGVMRWIWRIKPSMWCRAWGKGMTSWMVIIPGRRLCFSRISCVRCICVAIISRFPWRQITMMSCTSWKNRQPCVMSWLTSGGISMRMRRILLHFWPA